MISTLKWIPAANGGSQTVQYKKYTESDYSTFTTVVSTVDTIAVTGLDYNTIYNFRIVNNCPDGNNQTVLGNDVVFTCPQITTTPSDTTVLVQFFDLGGSIDKYVVDLLNPFTNVVLQSKNLVAPFSANVSTTFTSLSPVTQYSVRVRPNASTYSKDNCSAISLSTNNTPSCPIPTSLGVSFDNTGNATFSWIPQSGVSAEEAWYGKLADVGSTLPPGVGWNNNGGLLGASDSSVLFNGLSLNTKYRFLVKSHCTFGDSAYAELDSSKLKCPDVTISFTDTTINATLAITNPDEFPTVTDSISVALINIATSNVVSTVTLVSPYTASMSANFTGLTQNTNYNITVSTGNPLVICSTTPVTTAVTNVCTVITYTVTNRTDTSFDINITNLGSETYDISLNGGISYTYTGLTGTVTHITGLTIGTGYNVVIRRNCTPTPSLTPVQTVYTLSPNLTVSDAIQHTCPATPACAGRQVWATNVQVRKVSNNALIYNYDVNLAANPDLQVVRFVPALTEGDQYSVTASWTTDTGKTNGIASVGIQAASAFQQWSGGSTTQSHSLTFIANNSSNAIFVFAGSTGSNCTC